MSGEFASYNGKICVAHEDLPMITNNALSKMTVRDMEFLHELVIQRNLSQTATAMSTSIATLSKQLAKLREVLGDRLFVRTAVGMVPTPWMLEADRHLVDILSAISALATEEIFNPATASGTVHVVAVDNGIAAFGMTASKRIAKAAPGVNLEFLSPTPDIFFQLRKGIAELLIHPIDDVPRHFRYAELEPVRWKVLMRPNHPLLRDLSSDVAPMDLVRQWPHIGENDGADFYEANGLNVRIMLPYISMAPFFLLDSDFLMIYPETTAKLWERGSVLVSRCIELDEDLELRPKLIWHERTDKNPFFQWIRAIFISETKTCSGARWLS